MLNEFVSFLKEYKIVSLAIAFVMGTASTSVVNSLVKDIVMPLLSPLLSKAGPWQDAVWNLGSIHIAYGAFLAAFLNFIILAAIVFIVAKKLFKAEKATV